MAINVESKNLALGSGEIRFARFRPGTTEHVGYRLLGNCPMFSLSKNTQTIEHKSSMGGLLNKDRIIDLDPSLKGSIKTDDFSLANAVLWSQGYIDGVTVSAQADKVVTIAVPKQGFTYQLGQSTTNLMGDRNVSGVVVSRSATTFVLDTDYELDAANGLLYILPGGSITSSSAITVTYDVGASTKRISKAVSDTIEGELKFTSRNAVGPNYNLFIPRCSIKANGDLSLITDNQFIEMSFEINTLKRGSWDHYILETRSAVVV